MGAIRGSKKPENGRITFNVPDEMRDEPIIIEFRSANEKLPTTDTTLVDASRAFFAKLNRVKTDFTEEDYNVYEQ